MLITDFAEKIGCGRNNVYDLFKRGDKIDAAQLTLISKVLDFNFFAEVAKRPELINLDDEDIKRDMENRKAVSQFLDVMPDVLVGLNLEPTIVFAQYDKVWDTTLPDFQIPGFPVTFTIGQRLKDKVKEIPNQFIEIRSCSSPVGSIVDVWLNEHDYKATIDIPLMFHTVAEWESIMRFVFVELMPKYGALCSLDAPGIVRYDAYCEIKNQIII